MFRPTQRQRLADATTRTAGSIRLPGQGSTLLEIEGAITSPETGVSYGIERLLGEGGFGQVYLARRLGRSDRIPETVCIKASLHIDGWLREAYFGTLLDGHPRAIQVFDVFPLVGSDRGQTGVKPGSDRGQTRVRPGSDPARSASVLYCLALEYACHGDLSAFLTGGRREIAGILEVLGKLHRGQTLHRDLTPLNVFVCEGRRLKLGDFGIARQQSDRRGITARTLNALTAPSDILARAAPKWQTRDDVYQVGQLLAMLVKGDARARIRPPDVRVLACSDHLKEIIYRCIGERRKRYATADEMIEALRTPPPSLAAGVVRSLAGIHLAFTGILSKPRKMAIAAARRAGAVVHHGPSARTSVVVRGRPNPLQAAGRDGGVKLLEIKRLREKGHRITLLNEKRFWQLASRRKN